ncbi:MAG: hypothetical protein J6K15_15745 [Lachnospiraceae bacterium]|nr:hypothetical protein [Lachnospiraceae bacterium]
MKKELNSFHLKCICIGLMIVGIYLQQLIYTLNEETILAGEQLSAGLTLTYNMGYLIYLAAFPLAAFLLVEAAKKTSDRKKLLLRLLVTALIVELPMDMATFGISEWKNWGLNQNYFFTLCIALGVLMAVDAIGKKLTVGSMGNTISTLGVYLLGAILSILLRTEQSSIGVLMVITLYLFYGNKMFSLVSVAALYLLFVRGTTGLEFVPAISILLTWLYNGEQGKTGKVARAVFYFAFPVAYCVLGILAKVL